MEEKVVFPGWETMEKIGAGGFSKVYRIRRSSGDGYEYSALKVIRVPSSPEEYNEYRSEGYTDADITKIFRDQVQKIVQECELMSRFRDSDCIVNFKESKVIQHGDGQGWDVFIRMELLETLTDYFQRRGGMSEGEVIRLGTSMCRALTVCHRDNIVHRDLKPQNIFVDPDGSFKLGDFGIAKRMDHATIATKIGTYQYIAPEVYRGEKYDSQADIYSLGMVLYWLLNERRLPFMPLPPAVPTAADKEQAQNRRFSGEAVPKPLNGSDPLKNIVALACSFDPLKRWGGSGDHRNSAAVMSRALESCMRDDSEKTTVMKADRKNTAGTHNASASDGRAAYSGAQGTPGPSDTGVRSAAGEKPHAGGVKAKPVKGKVPVWLRIYPVILFIVSILSVLSAVLALTGLNHSLVVDNYYTSEEFYLDFNDWKTADVIYGLLSLACVILIVISAVKLLRRKKPAFVLLPLAEILSIAVNIVYGVSYFFLPHILDAYGLFEYTDMNFSMVAAFITAAALIPMAIAAAVKMKSSKESFK